MHGHWSWNKETPQAQGSVKGRLSVAFPLLSHPPLYTSISAPSSL